jgi:hypothetical protein
MPDPISSTFSRGAACLLAQCLSFPEWSKDDAGAKYRAGEIIEEVLVVTNERPDFTGSKLPTSVCQEQMDSWLNGPHSVNWSQRQFDVAKRCVAANLERLPNGRHCNSLLKALGLEPE